MNRKLLIVCAMAILASCAHFRHSDANGTPHIDAVRPDSVLLPRGGFVDIAIVGRGFAAGMPGSNTIEFAGTTITSVAADAAGTSIRFAVPDMISSGGEAPPVRVEAGSYSIRIRTAAGVSNAMTVRIYR